MLEVIGIIIFVLGAMAAESTSILAPVTLMAIGAGLYYIGTRLEGRRGR